MKLTSEDILRAQEMQKANPIPEELPDIEKLMDTVIMFLEYIATEPMRRLEESDPASFEKHLESKFSDFSNSNYGVFKLLLEKKHRAQNVNKLITLFSQLQSAKSGETTLDAVYADYTEGLNNEYIYPKFGGKEQFEQTMKNKHKSQ
jgi:hypothetical protein